MRALILTSLFILSISLPSNAQDIPSAKDQIAASIQALPAAMRENVTIMGYDQNGKLITLQKGSGNMVCLADNPMQPGFSAACYHKDLEPFMARGRALRANGKSSEEVFETREKEAKNGSLNMPDGPTTLHILYGKNAFYNQETGKVEKAIYRYVIYIPWATSASTGLPERPTVAGGPWIMDPGTHKAHIMVSPVQH
jgi:hypothetical protein